MMEAPSKQKLKKRRTRRNLDEIRKRSRSDHSNNVSSKHGNLLKLKNVSNYDNNNVQITSKRLTLALINNTVRSETVTRGRGLPRIVHKTNKQLHNSKNSFSTCSKQSLQSNPGSYKISTYVNKDHTHTHSKCQIDLKRNTKCNNAINNTPSSEAIPKTKKPQLNEALSYEFQTELKHEQEVLINDTSSCSSSDTETEHCVYERFMNDLPNYVKEHFPVLAKEGVMNKNIAHLRQAYWEDNHQDIVNNVRYQNGKGIVHRPINYEEVIIQNPMDYMQTGSSWQQTLNKKQSSTISSNSDSSLTQFGSDGPNIFLHDSPEYIYFPHKLNQ